MRSCLRAAAGLSTPRVARGERVPERATAPGRPQHSRWLRVPIAGGTVSAADVHQAAGSACLQVLDKPYRLRSLLPSGRVCPPVDSHVLSVPGGPLLHCVVCLVPAFHGCDRRTAKDTHNDGTELDDHRRASPYFRGKLSTTERFGP